jgi:predicted PurR-regulated permease PerM
MNPVKRKQGAGQRGNRTPRENEVRAGEGRDVVDRCGESVTEAVDHAAETSTSDPPPGRAMQLSHRQQQTIAVALTILASLVILASLGGVFGFMIRFLRTFSHVFLPVAVAGILAMVCQPYYHWLRHKRQLPVPAAIAIVFLTGLTPILGFLLFFGFLLVEQIRDLIATIPVLWDRTIAGAQELWPSAQTFLQENPVGKELNRVMKEAGGPVLRSLESFAGTLVAAGTGAIGWVGSLLGWFVLPVYFVFILTARREDTGPLTDYLPFLKEETRKDVEFLAHEFVNIMVTFFRGQLIIAFLQGLLYAVGFSVVGLKYGLLLGLMLGFLNIIPYLGSMLGLAITLPLAFFQADGGLWTLGMVVLVLIIVQTIEGYVLTPRIMGSRTGLHPMVIIVAIFFWGSALDGILGMILAIPLTAFLVVFWRLAKEKYIREWV